MPMADVDWRDFERKAQLCKAVANPTRLYILHLLAQREYSNAELLRVLKVPKANLSQHLSVLRSVGSVRIRAEGTYKWVSLAEPRLKDLCDVVGRIVTEPADSQQT